MGARLEMLAKRDGAGGTMRRRMAYRLGFDEHPPAALRRCAREQLEDAIDQLARRRGEDPVGAVHEARKSLKKTRAVLRLVQRDIPKRTYRHENQALRDAARSVSEVRDADVMVETVDGLKARFAGQIPAKTFTSLRRRLARQAQAARELDEGVLAKLVDDLRDAVTRVEDWPLEDIGWATARRGAVRSYARARKAGAIAVELPTAENLHEWRKRVKDHWYHQRLFEEVWPPVLAALSEEAHALSDTLGDDHDLAVLAQQLSDSDGPMSNLNVDGDAVLELVARRRTELAEAAAQLGRRIFAESPKAYGRRLERYVRAAAVEEPLSSAA